MDDDIELFIDELQELVNSGKIPSLKPSPITTRISWQLASKTDDAKRSVE